MEKAIIRYTLNGLSKRLPFDDVEEAIKKFKELDKNPQTHNLSIVY